MDRFIEFVREFLLIFSEYLKSNMDRFIVHENFSHADSEVDLKSNMDRFIGHQVILSELW